MSAGATDENEGARGCVARWEWRFPLFLSLFFVAVGTLPYAYGYARATNEVRFMGIVGRNTCDQNGYYMLAQQAKEGFQLFENRSTPNPTPRVFFNPEWWLFGKTARWTGLSFDAVFHGDRAASAFALIFAAYYFVSRCLPTVFERRLATALIVLGSGFGWMVLLASRALLWISPGLAGVASDRVVTGIPFHAVLFPVPLDVIGMSIPSYLASKPHFIRAGACILLTYAFLLEGERTGRRRFFLLGGVSALVHAAIRPFGIPEMGLVFVLFPVLLCVREGRFAARRIVDYAIPIIIIAPYIVYYAWLAKTNALGSPGPDWPPPHFVDQILITGLPFLLAFVGFGGLTRLRTTRPSTVLLLLWSMLAFLIAQSYPYFRAGQEGAFFAYVFVPPIVAVAGPLNWIGRAALRRRPGLASSVAKRAAARALVGCCIPSSVVAYVKMFEALKDRSAPYYLPESLCETLAWMQNHTKREEVVLSAFYTGQYASHVAGNKCFLAHYMLTPGFREKEAETRRFYGEGADDAFRRDLVARYGIRYVVWGPLERAEGTFDPTRCDWLTAIHEDRGTTVFDTGFASLSSREAESPARGS